MDNAEVVVRDLFARFFVDPARHAGGMGARGWSRSTRHGVRAQVADFIAGMTDRFAFQEHARLFPKPLT